MDASVIEQFKDPEVQAILQEYHALAHAMQTGVATALGMGLEKDSSKHVRVGINSALVDSSALGHLLISKGVITALEYVTTLRDGMKDEVTRYKALLEEAHPDKTFNLL